MLTKKGDRDGLSHSGRPPGRVEINRLSGSLQDAADLMRPNALVRITGTVDRGEKGTKIRGSKIEPLAEVQAQTIKRVRIRLTDHPDVTEQLPRLREVFLRHPGARPFAPLRMDLRWKPIRPPSLTDRHPQRTLCGRG